MENLDNEKNLENLDSENDAPLEAPGKSVPETPKSEKPKKKKTITDAHRQKLKENIRKARDSRGYISANRKQTQEENEKLKQDLEKAKGNNSACEVCKFEQNTY